MKEYEEVEEREEVIKKSMRDIQAASTVLRLMVSRVREAYPEMPRMDIRVTESEEPEPSSSRGQRLTITIDADTKEHAEQHGNQLQDQGCSCQSTGPTQVTCHCSLH